MSEKKIRVIYSFPHKLGADRICYTAWQQVNGLASAGADVLVFPGVLHRPVAPQVRVRPTLAWGKLRISYKLLGSLRDPTPTLGLLMKWFRRNAIASAFQCHPDMSMLTKQTSFAERKRNFNWLRDCCAHLTSSLELSLTGGLVPRNLHDINMAMMIDTISPIPRPEAATVHSQCFLLEDALRERGYTTPWRHGCARRRIETGSFP